ncbi:PilN domain-containing protein [Zooshikella ganghwensis]|uniref:Pilus assembly protein PilN n=1 Tax=Zooshikella ganghwensis TaxID=202772 RepID=A0A4P9VRR2_9GAMM|nr:PilN domain-containing protein [Zooshikella ganghwensis]RDH46273.1 pilus assembly protein PilN [Zooshikella ganghwensis]
MAKINLLPWREKRREERKKHFVTALAITVAVAAGLVFLGDRQINGAISNQQGRNEFLKKEIAALDTKIDEIKELKKRREQLLERMNVIKRLQGDRPIIVRVFDELVRAIPDGVYFNQLSLTGDKLSITGVAESNNRVSTLMRQFDSSKWFKEPNLASVKRNPANQSMNNFVMAVLKTTPEAAKKDKEE